MVFCCFDTTGSAGASYQRQVSSGCSNFPGLRRPENLVATGGNALMAAPTQTSHQHASTSLTNENNGSSLIQVTVPSGVSSGQKIHVVAPDGRIIEATVPPGMSDGSSFIVKAPGHSQEPSRLSQPYSAALASPRQSALLNEQNPSVSPAPQAPSQSSSPPPFSAALDSLVPSSLPGNVRKATLLHASPPPSAPVAEAYPISDLSASASPYHNANETNHHTINDQIFTSAVPLPPPVLAPHVTTDNQCQQHFQQEQVMVQVPPNSPPGTLIRVRVPDGQLIEARVPPGNVRQFLVAYTPTEQRPNSSTSPQLTQQSGCLYPGSSQQSGRTNQNQASFGQHRYDSNSGSSLMPFLGGAALGAAAMAIMEHSFGSGGRNFNGGGNDDAGCDYGGGDY